LTVWCIFLGVQVFLNRLAKVKRRRIKDWETRREDDFVELNKSLFHFPLEYTRTCICIYAQNNAPSGLIFLLLSSPSYVKRKQASMRDMRKPQSVPSQGVSKGRCLGAHRRQSHSGSLFPGPGHCQISHHKSHLMIHPNTVLRISSSPGSPSNITRSILSSSTFSARSPTARQRSKKARSFSSSHGL